MSDERHLPATERQRERFAERGEVARSRDLSTALTLCVGAAGCYAGLAQATTTLQTLIHDDYARLATALDPRTWAQQVSAVGAAIFPMLIACLVGALLSAALQTGGRFRLVPIEFKAERLDPLARLAQLFSPAQALKQVGWSSAKVAVLCIIAWMTLKPRLHAALATYPSNLSAAATFYGDVLGQMTVRCLAALLVMGLGDYAMNWWQLEKRMRMSYQEMREESKQENGDPRMRGRRRRRHQELIKRVSIAAVRKADVVLVNPTHYAVALRYDASTMRAPTLTAKGADLAAKRIRDLARHHGVPIVSQPQLARLLYTRVQVQRVIPDDLYQAVALVLAHVYGLRRRA
jgi:flagellar biosynthetic protein FlhB